MTKKYCLTDKSLGIIGTGMMGCSIAKYLKQNKQIKQIIGYSSGNSSQKAKELGVIDAIGNNVETLWQKCDIIILASPIQSIINYINILPPPQENQLVMDLGSVKQCILNACETSWGNQSKNFVGSHPITGLEHNGAQAADINLYKDARVILTPNAYNTESIINQACEFWQTLGANVHTMTAEEHDKYLAEVSHLPHILAFALVDGQYKRHGSEVFQWSAGGFRDFTRIASSSPIMWHDISLTNADNIRRALENFIEDLTQLKQFIEEQNSQSIESIYRNAKQARDAHYQK